MRHLNIIMENIAPEIQKKSDSYTLFFVFELPKPQDIADTNGKLLIEPEQFLSICLANAKERNTLNLKTGEQNSQDYFTDLNQVHRHRIPNTLHRLNADNHDVLYGIMSFIVYKDEPVKNKVHNQRISSINPHVIGVERLKCIYYPTSYQTERLIDFYPVGRVEMVEYANFGIVHIDEHVIQKLHNI